MVAKERLLWMYRTMVRHREFEERLAVEFESGAITGFLHLGQGQEAITAGAIGALREDDYFTSTHRGHGDLIARGEPMRSLMAELYGKKTGMLKGKGGSLHFANMDLGDSGTEGILGTGLVIAPGIALSARMRGTDQVCLCQFGDCCINTERFHAGVNLASCWKLPVIFFCINNIYGESTCIYDACNLTNLVDRAAGYSIPGVSVDGNDPVAVYETVDEAIARARKRGGPTFIEAKTYRWRGHFEGDAWHTYRTDEEVEEHKKMDPIPRFAEKLMKTGVLTEKMAKEIRQDALAEIDDAVKFAVESPYPEPEELYTDVYA